MKLKLLTDFVKVKRIISRDGAVQSRLEKRCPSVSKLMRASFVVFADSRHPRVDLFPAVHVLDGGFAKEEKHVVLVGHGVDETWI